MSGTLSLSITSFRGEEKPEKPLISFRCPCEVKRSVETKSVSDRGKEIEREQIANERL